MVSRHRQASRNPADAVCLSMCVTCENRGTGIYATLGKQADITEVDLADALFSASSATTSSAGSANAGSFTLQMPSADDLARPVHRGKTRASANAESHSQPGSRPSSRNSQRNGDWNTAGPSTLATPKRQRRLGETSVTPSKRPQSPSDTVAASSPGDSPFRADRAKRRAGELAQATVSQLYIDPFRRKRTKTTDYTSTQRDEEETDVEMEEALAAADCVVPCVACLTPTPTDVMVGQFSIPLCPRSVPSAEFVQAFL